VWGKEVPGVRSQFARLRERTPALTSRQSPATWRHHAAAAH
jgi:hypothetical protein